ncbi:MAG: hypothetical protein D6686_16195, partial [Alphaproteobacteria bacterium]
MPVIDAIPTARQAPGPTLLPGLALAPGRVHELCGPSRRALALLVAARLSGPVLWILPTHAPEWPHADGLAPWFDPARLVIAAPRQPRDMLWCMEEALRSGACPLVLAELPAPPG